MAEPQRSRTELDDLTQSYIPDNPTDRITPAAVRRVLRADRYAALNLADDGAPAGTAPPAYVLPSPNRRPGLWKAFRYLTAAELTANGGYGEAFSQLLAAACCVHTRVWVEFYHPGGAQADAYKQQLAPVYDAASTFKVFVDGSFKAGEQVVPVRWVPADAPEARYGVVRRDTTPPSISDWRVNELSIWTIDGSDRFATLKSSGGPFPAFAGIETANYKPAAAPEPQVPFAARLTLLAANDLYRARRAGLGVDYAITGDWNARVDVGRTVVVPGLSDGSLSSTGLLIGTGGGSQQVTVNVTAGTYRLADAPNSRPGGRFLTIFLTHADAVAAGRAGDESLDQINPELLVLGATARVDLHPDGPGVELVLAYDPQGPLLARLSGNLAGERDVKVSWQKVGAGVVTLTVAQLRALAGSYAPGQQYLVSDAPAGEASLQSPPGSYDTAPLTVWAYSKDRLAPFGMLDARAAGYDNTLVQVYDSSTNALLLLVLPVIGSGIYRGNFASNTAYLGTQTVSYQDGLYAAKGSFTSGANFNAADWDKLADGSGAAPTLRDIYDVPQTVRDAVSGGAYGTGATTGELQGTQPSGSLPGMRFKKGQAIYEYMRGDAGPLVWVRWPVG